MTDELMDALKKLPDVLRHLEANAADTRAVLSCELPVNFGLIHERFAALLREIGYLPQFASIVRSWGSESEGHAK